MLEYNASKTRCRALWLGLMLPLLRTAYCCCPQGLPDDDEAVQLAKLAAAQGYSLQDLLQQQRNGQPNAPLTAAAAAGKGGMIDPRNLPGVMLTKDPRSGRLTAAGSSSSDAVGLYGDLMRWCNPADLESQLAKRAQKKQKL